MLQMTCAAIGRESPKSTNTNSSKKRKTEGSGQSEPEPSRAKINPLDVSKGSSPRSVASDVTVKVSDEPKSVSSTAAPTNRTGEPPHSSRKSSLNKSPQKPAVQLRAHSTSPNSPLLQKIARKSNTPSPSAATAAAMAAFPVEQGNRATSANSARMAAALAAAATSSASSGLQGALLPTANSFLQTAELERYLRQLYSTPLAHPALSCYPTLPGLLPSMSYMTPYLPAATAWGATQNPLTASTLPGLAAYSSSHLPGFPSLGALPTAADAAEATVPSVPAATHACNWGSCGKTFATAELLANHVKSDHLSEPSTNSTSSASSSQQSSTKANATVGPAPSALASTVPRFSPYHAPNYPRDLLASRFVYS